jgi:hypothetical protein
MTKPFFLLASKMVLFFNATELLEQLDHIVGDRTSKNKYWPKTSSVLSRRINEVKTNLREVGIIIKEGEQDPVSRVRTIEITKPADIGKMPFEQFEQFDRRSEGESSNGMNGMNGILHNPDGPAPQNITSNDVSNEIVNNSTTNPILPPYVYRLGRSDRFAYRLCNIRDDTWGMVRSDKPRTCSNDSTTRL